MNQAYHYPEELELLTYPHPILRRPAEPVTLFDDQLAAFCRRMLDAMHQFKGVGLAAPQVGVSRQIFVSDHGGLMAEQDPPPSLERIWINPRIEQHQGSTTYEEGCLSFPGIYAKVERHDRFTVVWQDLQGAEQRLELNAADDVLGIVVQHELDHLHGKLFVDHLTTVQLTLVRRKLKEMEQAYKKATGKAGSILRR
ncbi:MAG: peptide deformylase [Planctomycetota bacterium]|nr:MAG: peptide deformylase [Planctomycetota bacterium]